MIRRVKYIVIHCTGANKIQSVESILAYWKNVLKWKNPGYHRIIEPDGTIHNLFPFEKVSNGVAGYNHESIHICYIGGQFEDDRTEQQKSIILKCIYEAVEWINGLQGLKKDEKISALKNEIIIQGHRDFPNVKKACPNFNAKSEYSWITA